MGSAPEKNSLASERKVFTGREAGKVIQWIFGIALGGRAIGKQGIHVDENDERKLGA